MKISKYVLFTWFTLLTVHSIQAQSHLTVDTSLSPTQLIKNVLLQGDNVKVDNIKYNGHPSAAGYFKMDEAGSFSLDNGIILSTGNANSSVGPNSSPSLSDTLSRGGDKDLQELSNRRTYDAAVLEFDFIPLNNKVSFTYIFASEEYLEYSESKYNDVFAFFISGAGIDGLKNMAIVPTTDNQVVSINTINQFRNRDYFIDNNTWRIDGKHKTEYELSFLDEQLTKDIEFDGMTIALKAETNVIPYKKYHFKIAIADVSDMQYNSAVFLKGGSFAAEIDSTATGVFSQVENIDADKIDFQAIFENKAFDIADDQITEKAIPEEYNAPKITPPAQPKENAPAKPVKPVKEEDKQEEGSMVLVLPAKFESVLFDYNSAILKEQEKASLDILAQMLKETSSASVYLSGHTDSKGDLPYNTMLSKKRVEAVYEYLKTKDIEAQRIKIEYFGEAQPKADNQSIEGRAINRRVEILLKNSI